MPIEIRELIIKASVSAGGSPSTSAAGAGQSGGSDNNDVPAGEEMISTCIEKIAEIQKEKNER